ncbi:chloride channel protein [Edaphobacter sp.]|uniref:chloride channel protein n=1 Tax=Edaphobacter sp. TaxID=1934404 RepID=UPI002DB63758|nr:chloride channel protein [Edaphobacter sp.]HEU5341183.1 chloride channel protein [Edaphobacter sp.]
MADFPFSQAPNGAEVKPRKKIQFGVALEPEVVKICCYAVLVGFVGGLVAEGLLELIYLFTNIFFYGRFSFAITNPAYNHLGLWVILIPPIGGLLVGIMVHYWEPTLKGHGIPEAMEAVLFGQSRMRLRVAFLKPLATAFAIGTGGPFGAEGPIIQTGAAFGSLFGQALGLTPYYRRVLLASGAAAGMAATFTAPLAGILVAIELLLFEFRARSFIPVSLAAAVATGVRIYFVGWAPLFPTPAFRLTSMNELWLFGVMGVLMGIIGIAMIRTLGWLEDFFDHLPVKRALIWSPAIGALALGIIGYFYPQIFGTGYDTIRDMLNDRLPANKLIGVSVAKFVALVVSLGSGTTGGVFAPSLIVGGGFGAVFGMGCHHLFPHLVSDPAFYALAAMAACFGGIARAPFTSIVFLFELSHNPNSLLPLIVCVMVADGFVRLFSRDSIMTSKLVKRGLIVLQDYSVPVLMRARIDQIMQKEFNSLDADDELRSVITRITPGHVGVIPVVEKDGSLVGIVEAHDLLKVDPPDHHFKMRELARQDYVMAYPDEPVDQVNRDMLLKNNENIVVVESHESHKPVGVARANDLLQLRRWLVQEETRETPANGSTGK